MTTRRFRSAEMAQQSESGRDRNERREHDRKTGNPYHLSQGVRMIGGLVAVIMVIALTGLFVSGMLHW